MIVAPRWSDLRAFGNSRIVKLTILMPFFGYLILLNENLAAWLKLKIPWVPDGVEWEFGWRLAFIYYGTMALGAGSLLFSIACPLLPKKYSSAVEYALSERDFFWPNTHYAALRKTLEIADTKLWWHQRSIEELAELPKKILVHANTKDDAQDLLIELMSFHWHILDTNRITARVVTMVLFAVGTLLVAYPSLATIWDVSIASKRYWQHLLTSGF